MKQRQKKTLIIITSIILVYVIFLVIFLPKKDSSLKDEQIRFILSPRTALTYYDGSWSRFSPSSTDEETMYSVYDNNKYVGEYHVMYNKYITGFNIFAGTTQKQTNIYKYEKDHDILAINSELDIGVQSFKSETVQDYDVIRTVLNSEKIQADMNALYKKKVVFDYDSDGTDEEIYLISNAFNGEMEDSNAFSFIVIKKGKNLIKVYESIEDSDKIYTICRPTIQHIVDLEGDGKNTLFFGCTYFSEQGTCHMIYGPKKGKYQMLLGC